jgi:hypothetical protein
MTLATHPTRLTIRLYCRDLPPAVHAGGGPTEFGLQDKQSAGSVSRAIPNAACSSI